MSRPSSASTNSANAFPRPAGATLLAPEPQSQHQLSPSRSTFSFEDSAQYGTESEAGLTYDHSWKNMRSVNRGAPGEKKGSQGTQPANYGSRRRAQYYEQQFAYKDDATSSARDRVTKDSPVIAELKTNVIIKDEYTLVTDLSHHLSSRFQRPESSVMITVNHSACLLLGGSFEPTYILTITAVPVQVQPTTNKRNAALIQSFMNESLGVPSDRGIIKFIAIQEENLAINGSTVLGEIERLERQHAEENPGGLKKAITKSSRRSGMGKSKSSMQLSRDSSKVSRSVITPPLPSPSPLDSGVAVDEKSTGIKPESKKSVEDSRPNKRSTSVKRPASRNALREKLGGRTTTAAVSIVTPSAIPEEPERQKISKRKSLISLFKGNSGTAKKAPRPEMETLKEN